MQPNRAAYPALMGLPSSLQDALTSLQGGGPEALARAAAQLPDGNMHHAAALQQLAQAQQQQLVAQQFAAGSVAPQLAHSSAAAHPEIALFNQFSQLLQPPAVSTGQPDLNTLHAISLDSLRDSVSRGRSRSESKSSSAYASRHQAAEQRRRTRINERLERLRKIVPHAERANTATFLEEVIKYIERLQAQIGALQGTAAPGGTNDNPVTAAAPSTGVLTGGQVAGTATVPSSLAAAASDHTGANKPAAASVAVGSTGVQPVAAAAAAPSAAPKSEATEAVSAPATDAAAAAGSEKPAMPPVAAQAADGADAGAAAQDSSSSENSGMPLKKRKLSPPAVQQ